MSDNEEKNVISIEPSEDKYGVYVWTFTLYIEKSGKTYTGEGKTKDDAITAAYRKLEEGKDG